MTPRLCGGPVCLWVLFFYAFGFSGASVLAIRSCLVGFRLCFGISCHLGHLAQRGFVLPAGLLYQRSRVSDQSVFSAFVARLGATTPTFTRLHPVRHSTTCDCAHGSMFYIAQDFQLCKQPTHAEDRHTTPASEPANQAAGCMPGGCGALPETGSALNHCAQALLEFACKVWLAAPRRPKLLALPLQRLM